MKKIITITFLIFSTFCLAQETKGTINVKKVDTSKSEMVLVNPESPAVFPEGDLAMRNYISKNVQYPEMEKEAGIQGTVWVTFIVELDGSITDVKLLRGIPGGPGCDKEALRVVKMMPKWSPGKLGNNPVKLQMQMPIIFKLK